MKHKQLFLGGDYIVLPTETYDKLRIINVTDNETGEFLYKAKVVPHPKKNIIIVADMDLFQEGKDE